MTIKKGIAVILSGSTVVHKALDDGDARFGYDSDSVTTVSGAVMMDHEGSSQNLSTVLTSIADAAGGDLNTVSGALDQEILNREAADGDLDLLKTEDKSDLVSAINEVHDEVGTEIQNVMAQEADTNPAMLNTIKELSDALGDDEDFSATILGNQGVLGSLATDDQSSLVAAIN